MAKTLKTKKQPIENIQTNTDTILDDKKNEIETPIVNDKNEIIYDPDKELKTIIEPLIEKTQNFEITVDDDVKEALTFLNENAEKFANMKNLDEDALKNFTEEKMGEITELKNKIEKNVKNNKYNFTSFWNGVSTNF